MDFILLEKEVKSEIKKEQVVKPEPKIRKTPLSKISIYCELLLNDKELENS